MHSRSLRVVMTLGMLATAACSDDDGPSGPGMDGGSPDGSIDASSDAMLDASPDADRGSACRSTTRYKFRAEGGISPWVQHYELGDNGLLRLTNLPREGVDAGASETCTVFVPCDSETKVDVREVHAALAMPAVEAAFGDGTQVLGGNPTVVDGELFVIEREDGDKIVVGSPCAASDTNCTPIPPAVESLRTLLATLIQERRVITPLDGGLLSFCPLNP